MGKGSYRRSARDQENNVGCMWGLIRMLYFRHDPKFLLNRKQGSKRHAVRDFAGRGHSRKKSMDIEEIDEDEDNVEECATRKPTVKKLMEDEMGKVKQLKKIPNDEVQRLLAELGNNVCLDNSSMQTSKPNGAKNYYTSITAPSGLLDPSGSKCVIQAKENDLELMLADFLGEIYRYHNECPHDTCKNKSELCPALKSLIQMKLNDLNNLPCSLDYDQTPESEDKDLDDKHLYSSMTIQSEKFMDALKTLSSNKELVMEMLEKPNSHILENIQKHQNRETGTKLELRKIIEKTNFVEEVKMSNHQELSMKTPGKESRHIFFWKKDKSNRRQISEGTNSSQPVNKIVILKPNPGRGVDPAVATSPRSLHQQPCTLQAPEYSARENSKFSIKEVRRRFRIVTGQCRKGRFSVPEDDLQRSPSWLRNSVITIKKDSRQLPEQTLADKSSAAAKNDGHSISSKQKQRIISQSEINSHIIASKDASIFYEEAKKHLMNKLKSKSEIAKHPTVQVSRSLVGLISFPQCSTLSPRSSPRVKDHIDLSPEETNACPTQREESAKYRSQSEENAGSIACGTSAAVDKQAVQEGYCMKEKATQYGATHVAIEVDTLSIEGINKLDCSKTICDALSIPAEQCRDNPVLEMIGDVQEKGHVQMCPSSPENVVEKLEHQDPKTPEPGASTELVPHRSPEGSHEKQEQPIPVSVLDPFFHEDVHSPDYKSTTECEFHEDFSKPQDSPHDESDLGIFWEDKSVRLEYIKLVLELSQLCAYQNLEVWYLEDELISPCLFEELQNQGDRTDLLKLLFDCICEALTAIQMRYFRISPWLSFIRHNVQEPPIGRNLISKVSKYVEGHLQGQFPSTLDQMVKRDLEDGTWMDLQPKTEGLIMEIWESMLDELIDEVLYDLQI